MSAALSNLAKEGKSRGLWIAPQADGWTYQVPSASRKGLVHTVVLGTQHHCTCEAWFYGNLCTHYALVLDHVTGGRLTTEGIPPPPRKRRLAAVG
jgi:hypothetical protein